MQTTPRIPDQVRAARRLVESLPWVRLVADLQWFDEYKMWGIHCRIRIDSPKPELVPGETDWWVLVPDSYPYGSIWFHPAKTNGLTVTFPHQKYNGGEDKSAPWRAGEICVRSPAFIFGKHAFDPDPIGHVHRLKWYFLRARQWLLDASAGQLLADGDPFELPDFSAGSPREYTVVNCESVETYHDWQMEKSTFGTTELVALGSSQASTFVLRKFLRPDQTVALQYNWGSAIASSRRIMPSAIWLRCKSMPILQPFQAIDHWEDMFSYLEAEGHDGSFFDMLGMIRDGKQHFLLLGFPVSERVGEPPRQLHWQPVLLPVVSHGTRSANGFRNNRLGYEHRDRMDVFRRKQAPDWQVAENWSPSSTHARGRIDQSLAIRQALVIGAGAVGSVIAELLVRSGSSSVVLCDHDNVEHGNLCRHTLNMEDVGKSKAEAVANRLVGAHVHSKSQCLPSRFPPIMEPAKLLVDDCQLIIDCTGEDELLLQLNRYHWKEAKFFCSISLSYAAKRVYVFTASGETFPLNEFQQQIQPWLKKDLEDFSGEELLQPEIGCWHPAFPARIDDVWMLASAAFRRLEEAVASEETGSRLVVFERVSNADGFQGIRRE